MILWVSLAFLGQVYWHCYRVGIKLGKWQLCPCHIIMKCNPIWPHNPLEMGRALSWAHPTTALLFSPAERPVAALFLCCLWTHILRLLTPVDAWPGAGRNIRWCKNKSFLLTFELFPKDLKLNIMLWNTLHHNERSGLTIQFQFTETYILSLKKSSSVQIDRGFLASLNCWLKNSSSDHG